MPHPPADPLLRWSGATPEVTRAPGSRIVQIPAGRFPSSARYTYVSIRTTGMAQAWVPAALPGVVSRHAGNIALGAVAETAILRLLAEPQQRATQLALMHNARLLPWLCRTTRTRVTRPASGWETACRSRSLEQAVTPSPEPGTGGSPLLSADQAEAVEKLYRAAAPKLFPRALLLSQGNHGQAEDLIQTVFQAAIMRWDTIGHKDSGEQMAWLTAVLHNKAADAWRVNRREHSLTVVVSSQPQPSQDAGYQALCSIALGRVLKVIKEMPPVRHRVACLRLLMGLPSREVAGMLGIEQSTVRGHVKGALTDLRREIGTDLPYVDDDPSACQRPPLEGR